MIYVPLGGMLLVFLFEILLNVLIVVSPCSAPWMVASVAPGECAISSGVQFVEALASAAILGLCGLAGLLAAVGGIGSQRNPALGVTAVICLVGGFLELFNAWLYS